MLVEWDVEVPMDDGAILRADVFRPEAPGVCPVILSHGPYGKGLAFQEGRAREWEELVSVRPEVLAGSSNCYQCWEVADPERWVPSGYACVRVDSRGAGRSPGFLDPLSPRETRDLRTCIEWAGTAPWSNGRVGLLGISYYAINQWQVASLAPAHLAAICPWEGGADFYRDLCRHGGILSRFWESWYPRRVLPVQHGVGERGFRSAVTGELVAGPETLTESELKENRVDFAELLRSHDLDDEFYQSRSPQWDKITVPVLSAANWGGQGLHSRGNFEGFVNSASSAKWLETHGGSHWDSFYSAEGLKLQRQFFDRFLKGEENGFGQDWRVMLRVRGTGGFQTRLEKEWPLARACSTPLYLDGRRLALATEVPPDGGPADYDALGPGLSFLGEPLPRPVEVTGPVACHLYVSTTADDADLFVVLRLFDTRMREVVFRGAQDRHAPVAQGWLRLSHRVLDPAASTPWRPYHSHDAIAPVERGQVYPVAVELWPTSIAAPAGRRLGLSIRGRDYQYHEDALAHGVSVRAMNGSGRCVHDDPADRDEARLTGTVTVHTGPATPSRLIVPVMP